MPSPSSSAAAATRDSDPFGAEDDSSTASLVADAVTWASTHGMVSLRREKTPPSFFLFGDRPLSRRSLLPLLLLLLTSSLLSLSDLLALSLHTKTKKKVVGLSGVPGAPGASLIHAPLSATPAPLPLRAFEDAAAASTSFNSLAAAVSLDEPWLEGTLSAAARADDFTARLLKVLRDTREYRMRNDEVVLLLSRSDYLLDKPSSKLLQVELNTIASSFGCLGDAASRMHQALSSKRDWGFEGKGRFSLPENGARAALAAGLAAAFTEVVSSTPSSSSTPEDSICLFVVQPGEKNAYDQALLAEALLVNHGVRSVRATLREIAERGKLLPPPSSSSGDGNGNGNGKKARAPLYFDGKRVAVAYLRSGYGPSDYPTELEWQARELLEMSDAALCPSVALQLAGAKKVQQALAAPGATERFLPDSSSAKLVRAHYAGLWGLDGAVPEEAEAANETLKEALTNPENFVLKPQREGGGNNLYGENLKAEIVRCGSKAGPSLAGFILMQRILPATHKALLVRNGISEKIDAVSELGIFGVHLRRGEKVLLNGRAGHLLRTKPSDADEGGVASGFAVLDSPMLVDA